MKSITRLSLVLILFSLFLIPSIGLAGMFANEDPMPLPQGSKTEAVKHNQEGIKHIYTRISVYIYIYVRFVLRLSLYILDIHIYGTHVHIYIYISSIHEHIHI